MTGARRPGPAAVGFWVGATVVTAGALWLRLAYIWTARDGRPLGGDALYYHATANLVAAGKGFVNPFVYLFEGGLEQSAEHPPLFSLYLAAVSWLGFTSVHDHLVAGAVLGSATVLVGALAGREIGGPVLGIVSAVLLAVYPNVWRHDGMVMSETAAVFTTVLTIWFAYRFWWHPSVGRAAALGVVVALAALARSELALLVPLLIVPLVLWKREAGSRRRARWLGAAGLGFAALVVPWLVFHYVRFDRPVLLSAQLEVTLATANCPGTYEGEWIGYWDLTCARTILQDRGIDDPTDPRVPDVLMEETRRYVSEHRERIPAVVAARWGRWAGVYRTDQQVEIIDSYIEGGTESVARAGIWTLWVAAGLSLLGAIALRRRRVPLTPLLAPVIATLVTVTVLYTATRFRAPADAALCFLAAAGVVGVARVVRRVATALVAPRRQRTTPPSSTQVAESTDSTEPATAVRSSTPTS